MQGSRTIVLMILATALAGCGSEDDAAMPNTINVTQRTWVDASRRTPPTSAYKGAPTRTLRTRIWMPSSTAPLPLLILAHGFGGSPEKFDAFARSVAAAGYIVAAPAFPLTNEAAPGGHELGFRDFVNQPGDITFVLTQLLAAADDPGDTLYRHLQEDQIAVLGHSLGGVTTIGLTRKDCCRDQRVTATILFAAVSGLDNSFGVDPITSGPPTLIVHGTADPTVAFETATALFDAIAAPRYLVGITGAGHSEALESQSEPPIAARARAQQATVAFLDAEFRGQQSAWSAVRAELAAAGNLVQADPL